MFRQKLQSVSKSKPTRRLRLLSCRNFMKRTERMKIILVKMRRVAIMVLAAALMLSACQSNTVTVTREVTRQVTVVVTQPAGSQPTPMQKQPSLMPKQLSTPALASMAIAPFPDAPLCEDSGEAH